MANSKDRFTIQVTVRHMVLYAIAIAGIAAALAFGFSRADSDVRSVIAYGSSLFGAMVALLTLLYTAQNIKQANDEKRSAAAAKFAERWNSPSYLDLKKQWRNLNEEMKMKKLTPEGRSTCLMNDVDKRMIVVEVLNFFEEMAVAVNTNALDAELLKRFFQTVVLRAWDRYGYWVAQYREGDGGRRIYTDLEELVSTWKEG